VSVRPPPLIGIDLVEPERLRGRLERRPALASRLFHPEERAYCERRRCPSLHLAARFCAKEAIAKALGLGALEPRDIEIVGGGESCRVLLHGDAARRASELGVDVTISLTHLHGVAGAVAMAASRLPAICQPDADADLVGAADHVTASSQLGPVPGRSPA
jgi:holo-[acyl-carrier protein] synthase